jgi:hypothetical protein
VIQNFYTITKIFTFGGSDSGKWTKVSCLLILRLVQGAAIHAVFWLCPIPHIQMLEHLWHFCSGPYWSTTIPYGKHLSLWNLKQVWLVWESQNPQRVVVLMEEEEVTCTKWKNFQYGTNLHCVKEMFHKPVYSDQIQTSTFCLDCVLPVFYTMQDSTLKMETACFSKTLIYNYAAQPRRPQSKHTLLWEYKILHTFLPSCSHEFIHTFVS